MAVDVPTWITAIATIGLLAGAAIYVVKDFGGQAKELAILRTATGPVLRRRTFTSSSRRW